MLDHAIISALQPLAVFCGIAAIIAADGWAKAARVRAKTRAGQSPASAVSPDAVLAELKALKEQIREMQDTGHQFDLSFDESLTRLEQRVSHLETKTAVAAPKAVDEPSLLKNGWNG